MAKQAKYKIGDTVKLCYAGIVGTGKVLDVRRTLFGNYCYRIESLATYESGVSKTVAWWVRQTDVYPSSYCLTYVRGVK